MSFDWTTEILSHFIGLFEIADERARMRDEYDRFKRDEAREHEAKLEAMGAPDFKAPFKLDNYSPTLKHKAVVYGDLKDTPFTPYVNPVLLSPAWPMIPLPSLLGYSPEGLSYSQDIVGDGVPASPQAGVPTGTFSFSMSLDPAGSVATYTFQSASLSDNDVIVGEGSINFLPVDGFVVPLNLYTAISSELQSFSANNLPSIEDTAVELAQSLQAAITDAQNDGPLTNAPDGATVTFQTGEDVGGIVVNGEAVDELPNLSELMPVRLKVTAEDGEKTVMSNGTAIEGKGINGVETSAPSQPQKAATPKPADYEVPDGHNVVMGGNTLVNETVVSTSWLDAPVMAVMGNVHAINAINQVNVVSDKDTGLAQTTDSETLSLNMAQVNQFTNPFAPSGSALPSHWVVAKLDADVISSNWVEQFSFVTDHDIAEVSFTGQDTFLQLGDNSVVNAAQFKEIGFGYDLIVVGGSIFNINAISQTNVLFDNDFLSSSDEDLGAVNSSGNLLANSASITSYGVDHYSAMSEGVADAFDQIEAGFNTIHNAFAQLTPFNGIELMRVLHITGDLIQMNMVKQTNILGDADQVHVALDNFLGEHSDVSVNTGDNALVNVASIGTYGLDSNVYVQGDVYSDALLVQAELIDTDADPLGVSLSSGDLANEAVAFLADDMITPSGLENGPDYAIAPTPTEDTSGSPDSLQVMLA